MREIIVIHSGDIASFGDFQAAVQAIGKAAVFFSLDQHNPGIQLRRLLQKALIGPTGAVIV